ncbi:hypothetical protein AB0E04_17800 [Streptomyces sp. NPDC048251]|uniref:hypothetical protein n=1 Tax=Streptomyces sp. NPDC048251 TaxID=3154501 RepID=UPI00342DAA4B
MPEIWLVLQQEVEPDLFTDEDAAAIRAGALRVYGIALIDERTDENFDDHTKWVELDSCWNYIGTPGHDKVYSDPRNIQHEWLRYYATDMWAFACGVMEGDLVGHNGQIHWVMTPEFADQDYGSIGTATGYLFLVPTAGGYPTRVWLGDAQPVKELGARVSATRCATVVHDLYDPPEDQCTGVATHTLFYSLRDPETQVREYFQEPACLPCAGSFMRRPALQATAYIIGQEPVPMLRPDENAPVQTDQSDSKEGGE